MSDELWRVFKMIDHEGEEFIVRIDSARVVNNDVYSNVESGAWMTSKLVERRPASFDFKGVILSHEKPKRYEAMPS